MNCCTKKFESLSTEELYEILQLRSEIFVMEQQCLYQDIDGKDLNALHVLGTKNGKLVAYARCFDKGIYSENAAIGRMLVRQSEREKGYAHTLLKAAIDAVFIKYGPQTIQLSAQQYLIEFYGSHGFKTQGKGYLEDGIPHILMLRNENFSNN